MKKNKHDHKGTKALKLTIFFTLMLAPFMAVLFKCAYVTFNKNAKDSYSGINGYQYEYKYQTNEVNSYADIRTSNIYTYELTYIDTPILSVGNISFIKQTRSNQEVIAQQFETTTNAYLYTTNGRLEWYINLLNTGGTIRLDATLPTQLVFTNFTSQFQNLIDYNDVRECAIEDNVLSGITISNTGTLDNAFYYAVDEAMESPYFAWARTSALYTATSGLTNGMGITTQAIPTLIVYWLILTAIYVIIDIVIESFVYLTHCIMNRFE